MGVLKTVEWANGDFVMACDFDARNRVTALVKLASDNIVVQVDGVALVIPEMWKTHVKRVRWLSETEIVLWPVCFPKDNLSYVGKIGISETTILDLGYPLDIFVDGKFVVCTFPEEQFISTNDIDLQSDLIAVFSRKNMSKMAKFIEPFMSNFSHIPFMEVEHGAVDSSKGCFWFSAYDTRYLWCLIFENAEVLTCTLECDRSSIFAITCVENKCFVLFQRAGRVVVGTYRRSAHSLEFESEFELSLNGVLSEQLQRLYEKTPGFAEGFAGGRVAVTTAERSMLVKL